MIKRIMLIFLAVVIGAQLAGCSAEKETSFLTEEQLASDHLVLEEELTDKVRVDAEITPYDRYKDGLNAYYPASREINWISEEEFEGKLEKILDCLQKYSTAGMELEREWLNGSNPLYIQMEEEKDGGTRALRMAWGHGSGRYADFLSYIDYSYYAADQEHNGATNLISNHSYEGGELAFAASEEAERQARAVLEKLTGQTYAEYYRYVAVDEEAKEILRAEGYIPDTRVSEEFRGYEERDYYVFFFYQDVDGFPWRYLSLNAMLEGTADIGADVTYDPASNILYSLFEQKKMVSIGQDGIRCMWGYFDIQLGELYRERETVCDVGQILEKTKDYFERTYVSDQLTIVSIELTYSSYFSDPNEGTIHNIVAPFWVVRCRNEFTQKLYDMIYDAYTGEFILYCNHML